jgi:type I restriction enzyme S subunit
MTLIKLGQLIELNEEKNDNLVYKIESLRGISIKKTFIKTKANMDNVPLNAYKVINPLHFCYVTITSRNSEKMTIALNDTSESFISSSSYISFKVKDTKKILPFYLFIYFNRPEFDRYVRFNSWGSARESFSWESMCDIEFKLPSIVVQQKAVDVYVSLIENKKVYEKRLQDLKIAYEGYIENIKNHYKSQTIGNYIKETKEINKNLEVKLERGLNKLKGFVKPGSMSENVDLSKRKIVRLNNFVYPSPHFGEQGTIGLFKEKTCIVSQMYTVFKVVDEKLNPDYLNLWLRRTEFMRYAFFASSDSVRDTFDFGKLSDYKIPIPSLEIQSSIVEIFKAYEKSKSIIEQLTEKINNICPLLIVGSIQ